MGEINELFDQGRIFAVENYKIKLKTAFLKDGRERHKWQWTDSEIDAMIDRVQ